jgi:hypothetical protein
MTFTLIILTATFLAAVWLAVDLLRPALGERLRERSEAASVPRRVASYQPVARLLEDGDFEFLANQTDLADRLSRSRRAAMRLYLRQIRRDFLEIWSVCRLLAPISPDPALASRLSRQYWSFHWAYARVQVQCLMPAGVRKPAVANHLVAALTEIRDQAQLLLAASDSALNAPAAA